jgi:hypothetical protein
MVEIDSALPPLTSKPPIGKLQTLSKVIKKESETEYSLDLLESHEEIED